MNLLSLINLSLVNIYCSTNCQTFDACVQILDVMFLFKNFWDPKTFNLVTTTAASHPPPSLPKSLSQSRSLPAAVPLSSSPSIPLSLSLSMVPLQFGSLPAAPLCSPLPQILSFHALLPRFLHAAPGSPIPASRTLLPLSPLSRFLSRLLLVGNPHTGRQGAAAAGAAEQRRPMRSVRGASEVPPTGTPLSVAHERCGGTRAAVTHAWPAARSWYFDDRAHMSMTNDGSKVKVPQKHPLFRI